MANCPARGKSGNSVPSPESMRMVLPPLRTTATFSGQSSISGGRYMSLSQADRSAGAALVAIVDGGYRQHPVADHHHVDVADLQRVARRNQFVVAPAVPRCAVVSKLMFFSS